MICRSRMVASVMELVTCCYTARQASWSGQGWSQLQEGTPMMQPSSESGPSMAVTTSPTVMWCEARVRRTPPWGHKTLEDLGEVGAWQFQARGQVLGQTVGPILGKGRECAECVAGGGREEHIRIL